jgi:hypothetical protein
MRALGLRPFRARWGVDHRAWCRRCGGPGETDPGCRDDGVSMRDLHLGIGSVEPGSQGRRAGMEYLRRCIDLAEAIGATVVVGAFCGVGGHHIPSADERGARNAVAVDALRSAAPIAKSAGVRLGLEPLNRYENNFLNTVGQAMSIVDDVNHPAVGVHLDLFHANIRGGRSEADDCHGRPTARPLPCRRFESRRAGQRPPAVVVGRGRAGRRGLLGSARHQDVRSRERGDRRAGGVLAAVRRDAGRSRARRHCVSAETHGVPACDGCPRSTPSSAESSGTMVSIRDRVVMNRADRGVAA